MKVTLSQRARSIQPSLTLELSAQAKQMKSEGIPVLDFTAGEPDFDTPEEIKQAAEEALRAGFTKYTAGGGIAELKDAIRKKCLRDLNVDYDRDQVLVSNGGKHALHNLFQALLDPGDEVIVPAPYWVSYPDMVRLSGGVPVIVETALADGYKLGAAALEAAITPRTRLLVLNSPGNPTGAVYGPQDLSELAAVVERHDLTVVSDDVYEPFVYDGGRFTSILERAPQLRHQVCIVNSASKSYSMPGWRMGFAAGPAEVIRAATRIQGQATSCPGSISQKAYARALSGGQASVQRFKRSFESRRDLIFAGVDAIDGIRCFRPEGAFYLFADVSRWYERLPGVAGSAAFCAHLLDKLHIACIPGEAFGDDRCIRFSFVTAEDDIREAVFRLASLTSE